MTIGENINDVKIAVANRTGKTVDETRLPDPAIYRRLKDNRIYILREKRKKGRDFTSYDLMTLPCVELIEANLSECPWLPTDGSIVLRTKYGLPRTLEGMLHSVSNINFTDSYDYRSIEALSDLRGGRFPSSIEGSIYTTQNVNGEFHVYLLNDIHKDGIAIRLLPEDPLEVLEYPECGKVINKECINPYDKEFPIDADLRKIVIEMTVDYFLTKITPLGDIKQNLTDDTAIQPNNIK